jgi:transposase
MAEQLTLELTPQQRNELEDLRDHHDKPYLRERAAALLKIAQGSSARWVALQGLLKRRQPDTVYAWVHRYERAGLEGLFIRAGRGRRPAFSPQHTLERKARRALLQVIRRDPCQLGFRRTRWTLSMIRDHCSWLTLDSDSGLYRLLRRLGISYKRGRNYVHSPDPAYQAKCDYSEARRREAAAMQHSGSARTVLLYQDECSYTQQPTLEKAYAGRGHQQPLADWGCRSGAIQRVAGALHPQRGRVHYLHRPSIGRHELVDFYHRLRQAYPQAEPIYLVQDNNPMHFHPDVLCQLQEQQWPWPFFRPAKWSKLKARPRVAEPLPIQLLCLPTYASWLNPIEKLWRYLRQEVLHLHRMSEAWPELKQRVGRFLDQFADGSLGLLRYCGLLPE